MQKDKIKVTAPASNPHICYIPKELEQQVKAIKKKTGMSLYRIICTSVGITLSDKEKIKACKKKLKALGYKTIGEWVAILITKIYESKEYTEIPEPIKKEKTNGDRG